MVEMVSGSTGSRGRAAWCVSLRKPRRRAAAAATRATLGPLCSVKAHPPKRNRKGSGLGIDFFGGMANSTIHLEGVQRWRYMCTNATSARASGISYPRPPQYPGKNMIVINEQCVRGRCYNDSLFYPDFAFHINPDSSESSEYLEGYSVWLQNSTRICETYILPACTAVQSNDQCQIEGIEAWLASLRSADDHSRAVAATAAGVSAGVVALGAITAAALWQRRRRKQARGAGTKADVEAGVVG